MPDEPTSQCGAAQVGSRASGARRNHAIVGRPCIDRPSLARDRQIWGGWGRSSPDVGQFWPSSGRIWPYVSPNSAEFGRSRPESGKMWPEVGRRWPDEERNRPNAPKFRAASAKDGRNRAKSGQARPKLGRLGPASWTGVGYSRLGFLTDAATFGRIRARCSSIRHQSGCPPEFGRDAVRPAPNLGAPWRVFAGRCAEIQVSHDTSRPRPKRMCTEAIVLRVWVTFSNKAQRC